MSEKSFEQWMEDRLGQYKDGTIREAIEAGTDGAGVHGELGNALAAQGKLSEALGCWEKALEKDPTLAKAHLHRGYALSSMGRKEEALAELKLAAQLGPENPKPHW